MKAMSLKIAFDPSHEEFLRFKYSNLCQFPSDVGFDLFIPTDVVIHPGETKMISLGIRAEYSDCQRSYGYVLYPRSSISKTKLRLANSAGIIDPHYRGYLIVAVDNIGNAPEILKAGERYFQLVFMQLNRPTEIKIVNESDLSETDRGAGGFGSTGL